MQTLWDVLIIGGGPAGGLAALDCAKQGFNVLLVEQRTFPRWKVCGCCFNNQAQAILSSRGLNNLIANSGGLPLQSLHLGLNGREARCSYPMAMRFRENHSTKPSSMQLSKLEHELASR